MKKSSGPLSAAIILAIGAVVVGLVLMVGFRHFQGNGAMLAGFLLGVLLLVIGAAGLAVAGTQTVTVDPAYRRIVVEDRTLLGARTREIALRLAKGPTVAYRYMKENLNRAMAGDVDECLDLDRLVADLSA